MNLPATIAPEVAVWIRLQMTEAAARLAEPLHQEIRRVDEWANGLFTVLAAVLPALLRSDPALAQQLEPQWRRAAERFEALEAGADPIEPEENIDRLEAPKMLYRLLDTMGVWAEASRARPHKASKRRG